MNLKEGIKSIFNWIMRYYYYVPELADKGKTSLKAKQNLRVSRWDITWKREADFGTDNRYKKREKVDSERVELRECRPRESRSRKGQLQKDRYQEVRRLSPRTLSPGKSNPSIGQLIFQNPSWNNFNWSICMRRRSTFLNITFPSE